MLFDVAARVLSNQRLSADYHVIALEAPEIARAAAPGQFVMVKPSRGTDPLLRRPFSLFEILRDADGTVRGLSLLCKRVGVTTSQLYDAHVGDIVSCLGPLGNTFEAVTPPAEAWMVAGGVGLAPFATLTEALARLGTPTTLFYGARTAVELFYVDFFERRGVHVVLATEDGTRGEPGRVTAPLECALQARAAAASPTIYACGPGPMLAAVARLAAVYGRPSQVSVERVMGCGMGGCYSCVVLARGADGRPHFVRSCVNGPVFAGADLVWE